MQFAISVPCAVCVLNRCSGVSKSTQKIYFAHDPRRCPRRCPIELLWSFYGAFLFSLKFHGAQARGPGERSIKRYSYAVYLLGRDPRAKLLTTRVLASDPDSNRETEV